MGEFQLSHPPLPVDPLSGKKQCVTPIDTVYRINDQHQPSLLILCCEGEISEEIWLERTVRPDFGQINACFIVAVSILIDLLQPIQRRAYDIRSKGCGIGKVDRVGAGLLQDVFLKRVGTNEDRQTASKRVLFT